MPGPRRGVVGFVSLKAAEKRAALEAAGVKVVDSPADMGEIVFKALRVS